MKPLEFKAALASGEPLLTANMTFPHPSAAEYLARLGFDAIMVDREHSGITEAEVTNVARACKAGGAMLLLHAPYDDAVMQRYLGAGVDGFHIPMVRSAALARAAVESIKFPPVGLRGLGTINSNAYGLSEESWPDHMARMNRETFISVSIENLDGLSAIPELVKIPELDVIQIAGLDLSASLGFPGQKQHPKVVEAGDSAIAAARTAGKVAGLSAASVGDVREGYKRGARFMIVNMTSIMSIGAQAYFGVREEFRRH